MIRFSFEKLLRLIVLLFAVATVSHALVSLSPVDPVRAYAGADVVRLSPEQRRQSEARFGLDLPAHERYLKWLGSVARGDFGRSQICERPVLEVIAEKSLLSAGLMVAAWILSGLVGFGLGVLAGATQGSRLDRGVRWFAYLVASAPAFWVGMVLLMLFSRLPAVNVHFAAFSELFGGAILAEQVFAYPGLGQATVQAGLRSDVPLLLGIVLFSAVFVFCGSTLADLICRAVDPRIMLGERR